MGVVGSFNGTRLRNRRALYDDGKTQDERAVGEVSFAHGGCGGINSPHEDPASAERTQCAFSTRVARSLLYQSAFRRNAQADSRHKSSLLGCESACARQSLALLNKRLRTSLRSSAVIALTRAPAAGFLRGITPSRSRARFACACFAPVIIQSPFLSLCRTPIRKRKGNLSPTPPRTPKRDACRARQ